MLSLVVVGSKSAFMLKIVVSQVTDSVGKPEMCVPAKVSTGSTASPSDLHSTSSSLCYSFRRSHAIATGSQYQ